MTDFNKMLEAVKRDAIGKTLILSSRNPRMNRSYVVGSVEVRDGKFYLRSQDYGGGRYTSIPFDENGIIRLVCFGTTSCIRQNPQMGRYTIQYRLANTPPNAALNN